MIYAALTFFVVLSIVVGIYAALAVAPERRAEAKLRKRLGGGRAAAKLRQRILKEQERYSDLKMLDRVLAGQARLGAPLAKTVRESGLRITVGTLLLSSATLAALGVVVVWNFVGLWWLAIAAGSVAGLVPYAYVRMKRKRRLDRFEAQFPEAIGLIARAMRAGHAFSTGLNMVAEELDDPVGTEFKQLYDEQNFGRPMPDALKGFAERVPLIDARFFVTAVLTQRDAGGNLAEVLDNLGTVIRDRFKVKRQIRIISAHGRLTGWILACLPPGLATVLFASAPEKFSILFTDPLGHQMIFGAIVLQVVGILIMRKIINVEY